MDARRPALPLNRRDALLGLGIAVGAVAASWPSAAAPDGHLDPDGERIVASVADTILPKTDTEGAIGAGVVPFIGLIVTAWMTAAEREAFLDDMRRFSAHAATDLGGPFWSQPQAKREAYLTEALRQAQASLPSLKAPQHAPFVVWMKRLTLHGYYTSEIGASQELELNLVPGAYDACHHMAAGDKSFSLDRRQTPMVIDLQSYQPK